MKSSPNYLLKQNHGKRICVIENEFGSGLGIETLIAKSGVNGESLDGFFEFLEQTMITGDGSEAVFFDSTHAKVHQHAYGAGPTEDENQFNKSKSIQ
jgi:hypothetical protein